MRIFVLILFVGLSVASASSTDAQVKMDIRMNRVSLVQLFDEIEAKSEYIFFYKDGVLDQDVKVSVKKTRATITEVLDEALAESGLEYVLFDRQVVVKLKPQTPKASSLSGVQAVELTVSGTVYDENGESLPGATVIEKGTTNGTITDLEGKYQLRVAGPSSVLQISFVGYSVTEVEVGDQTNFETSLTPDVEALNEVVVVGYGEKSKESVTGAIEVVKGKEVFESRAVTNPALALQGQTPGITVTRGSARPGNEDINLQIRGFASINQDPPLILIDNVPVLNAREFYNMNPDDIESISVLKDAATAIYGARGANGVILVTTKKGTVGDLKVNYSGNFRMQRIGLTPKAANMRQYGRLWLEANEEMPEEGRNYWGWGTAEQVQLLADGYEGYMTDVYVGWAGMYVKDVDRIDEFYGNAYSQQHNISVSGGNESTRYRISGLFSDDVGALKLAYDGQKQYNLRFNFNHELSDKVSLSSGITYQKRIRSSPSNGVGGRAFQQNPWIFPSINPQGQYVAHFGIIGSENFRASVESGGRAKLDEDLIKTNLGLTAELVEGLNLELTGSYNRRLASTDTTNIDLPLYDWDGNFANYTSQIKEGITDSYEENDYLNYGAYLAYQKTIGKHNLSAKVGVTGDYSRTEGNSITRNGFWEDFGVYDLNVAPETNVKTSGGSTHWGLYAYLTRLAYDYKGKYLFDVVARRDVSSRFAKGYKGVNYGGFSAGWIVSDESFLKDVSFLNFLKLKGSYGETGNQSGINEFSYLSTVNYSTRIFGVSPALHRAAGIPRIIDPTVTWERINIANVGMEFSLLDYKLNGSFDFYTRNNNEMLLSVQYGSVMGNGGTGPLTNSGDLKGHGWEAVLGWKDQVGEVTYSVSANVSDNRNQIVRLDGANIPVLNTQGINIEGYPIGALFLWENDGFFESQEEVNEFYNTYTGQFPKQGNTGLRPGDVVKVDRNNDGVISTENGEDLKYVGELSPHYNFGVNLGASWNGFDFQATFQGVLDQNIYRQEGNLSAPFAGSRFANQTAAFLGKTWREDNQDAAYPRLTWNTELARHNWHDNEWFLQNNRYMRLKTLVIGYTLPVALTQKAAIDKARVYFSGNDLFEFTAVRDGYDPESRGNSSEIYPFLRTYSLGLDLTF
ncbi:TonB-dependent receptor [Marinoscillum furvescens]|nr:TonB-dependent receptor [Marinoscillum furvescens]